MTSRNPLKAWQAFFALPNSSPVKAIGMVLLVAFSCSLLVSLTAITLKPIQDANRLRESNASLMAVVELLGGGIPTERHVELSTGHYTEDRTDATNPLTSDQDLAGLGEIEIIAVTYELLRKGQVERIILPVRGRGYQSQLHGYLALESDLNTVASLIFHKQAETPGIGTRILEPEWQAVWVGKKIADEEGHIRIAVTREPASTVYEVDGISGATMTSNGVSNLVRFWMGPDGYGPYLDRLKREQER